MRRASANEGFAYWWHLCREYEPRVAGRLQTMRGGLLICRSWNEFDFYKLCSGTIGGHNYRGPRVALMNDRDQRLGIMHSEDRGWAIPPLTKEMKEKGLRPNIRPHMGDDDQYHSR